LRAWSQGDLEYAGALRSSANDLELNRVA